MIFLKKSILLLIGFYLSFLVHGICQSPTHPNKNLIRASIGLGYDDGLIYLPAPPTLGISYERKINKRFSFAAHLLWYYRNFSNTFFIRHNDFPVIDGFDFSESPFFTGEQIEALNESGTYQFLDLRNTLKYMSIPFDVGLSFYPIRKEHHSLGINLAYSLTYENINHPSDLIPMTFTQENGTSFDITFTGITEIRNLSQGASLKLFYEYHFNDYLVGARVGNYNFISVNWFPINQTVWETSLYFGFKF